MALSGFASGALVAAPIAAVLTWLAFNAGFASDWSAATGQPRPACDPNEAAELARLRKRTAELEARLAGSSDDLERNARELHNLMVEDKQ